MFLMTNLDKIHDNNSKDETRGEDTESSMKKLDEADILPSNEKLKGETQPLSYGILPSDTLASAAVKEYMRRFAPKEGLSPETKNKLICYSSFAAIKLHNKVRIKEAAREILCASRKEGVEDSMMMKIFQCLKSVEDSVIHKMPIQQKEKSPTTPQSLAKFNSEDSSDSTSVASVDFEAKFGLMEDVDESEDIQAFLTRFKTLVEGGHFPDANIDALEVICQKSEAKDYGDDVEVDLVHGFVKKDFLVSDKELTTEEKLWSEGPDKDLYRRYSDFLKKIPVEVENPSDLHKRLKTLDKYLITEVHDVNSGDTEVYLMDESVVEVAYVNEEEEKRAAEKPKKVEKSSSINSDDKRKGRVGAFQKPGEKLAALEKMFEERDEMIIREFTKRSTRLERWMSPWERSFRIDQDSIVSARKIDGVASAAAASMTNQSRRRRMELHFPVTQHWRKSYKERTKAHTGYFDVDYFSLKESSVVSGQRHRLDDVPWEHRDVKQRLLLGKDIAFNRNWFGRFVTWHFRCLPCQFFISVVDSSIICLTSCLIV